MELRSQKLRKIAPELDPLRLGTGWGKRRLVKNTDYDRKYFR